MAVLLLKRAIDTIIQGNRLPISQQKLSPVLTFMPLQDISQSNPMKISMSHPDPMLVYGQAVPLNLFGLMKIQSDVNKSNVQ